MLWRWRRRRRGKRLGMSSGSCWLSPGVPVDRLTQPDRDGPLGPIGPATSKYSVWAGWGRRERGLPMAPARQGKQLDVVVEEVIIHHWKCEASLWQSQKERQGKEPKTKHNKLTQHKRNPAACRPLGSRLF
ncbi:hypothetical protein BO71DRAFT_42049 [Aspergillus ellipticus CBS 707.79]|uniref:Uncharacterized protein n=1 Tax=Aspergillus ellipticus CBS 707.79 TaxID=1448320 RepID=A0A319DM36_9EURO|nr:hypothetical protein BO71DRAFT_42049 [Aspergillus ellipticus CBS 707.79]